MGWVRKRVEETKENVVDPVVDTVKDVGSAVDDAIIHPVVDAVENTVEAALDDPIKTAAIAAAVATGQPHLIPYIQGGAALADGASVEDALVSAGKAYVLQQAAGGVSSELSPTMGTTAGNAAGAATVAGLTGGDPLQAAVNSGMNAGINAAVNSGIDALPSSTPDTSTSDTKFPVQDLGPVDTDTEFYSGEPGTGNAGSFDPETGYYTYNYDDGSSITYDDSGNVIDSTESTDTPYTAPGSNIKLPSANFFPTAVSAATVPMSSSGTTTAAESSTVDPMTLAPTSSKRPGATDDGSQLNPLLFKLFSTPKITAGQDPFSDISLGTSAFGSTPTPQASTDQFSDLPIETASFAEGGLASAHPAGEPQFYSEGGLNNRYIKGEGDGTSDSIPAMVADSEFVMPADVVAALGNGSSDAGASKLDQMVEQIRKRARSTAPSELPPTAYESPLDYLKGRA